MKEEAFLPLGIVALVIAVPVSLMTVYSIIGLILSMFGIELPR